ncbi:prepilin-type N-terminal cleavage/methylation domain-containing protein [Aerococcaceae bacterium DSM 111021]|nr:prepilin-type N-terminal cleavage/methylation domain-containing protein [Aerococcaceae bacterium DSM 111021]
MNKKGYTLIESLIVLVIISGMSLILMIQPDVNITKQIESRMFFDEVMSHLKRAQQLAILQRTIISVEFHASLNQLRIRDIYSQERIATIDAPDHIEFLTPFMFWYLQSGSVDYFRTVSFYDSNIEERIYLVFQLGNGQFELQR